MSEHVVLVAKALCFGLAIVVSLQLYGLKQSDDLLPQGLVAPGRASEAESGTDRSRAGSPDGKPDAEDPPGDEPVFPEEYGVIASSGILGIEPPKKPPPPPQLVGLMDSSEKKYAVLRAGKTFMLAEGEEKNGVKLIRIGTNRVVVEHLGKEVELSLFSGLGSPPLLSPDRGQPRSAKQDERQK